ncbi:unnamed protein product, partial [Phaeothamnion confervicola]
MYGAQGADRGPWAGALTVAGDGALGRSRINDFEALNEANVLLLQQLRNDEKAPDLARRLSASSGNGGTEGPPAFNYCCGLAPDLAIGPHVRYQGVTPWPPRLAAAFASTECMSYMGLLPEIGHAWMSADSRLYLWNYEQSVDFTTYSALDGYVVAVALAPPRPGVFKDVVKYVLAVATSSEIRLLAVTGAGADATMMDTDGAPSSSPPGTDPLGGRMALRATQFAAPMDGVRATRLLAHPNGRIFFAGTDGSFSELVYGTGSGGLLRRSLDAALGATLGLTLRWAPAPRRDCRTVTHHGRGSGWVPAFFRTMSGSGIIGSGGDDVGVGGGGGSGALLDAVVDPWRNALYVGDVSGNVTLYDLGEDAGRATPSGATLNVWRAAHSYCALQGRYGGPIGALHGMAAAKDFDAGHGLSLAGLHVVDPSESAAIHLVAVASSGHRVYFETRYGEGRRPGQLTVRHVRPPPPAALLRHLREAHGPGDGNVLQERREGYPPSYAKGAGLQNSVHGSYYSHGLLLLAAGYDERAGSLVAVAPDAVARRHPARPAAGAYSLGLGPGGFGGGLVPAGAAGGAAGGSSAEGPDPPSLREVVAEIGDSEDDGGGFSGDAMQPALGGEVWAMTEEAPLLHDPSASGLVTLLVASRTPSDRE